MAKYLSRRNKIEGLKDVKLCLLKNKQDKINSVCGLILSFIR